MAAVLFVLYIPCDKDDNDDEESRRVTSKSDLNVSVPKVHSADSDTIITATGTADCIDGVGTGQVVLIKKDVLSEHENLPLLEHAAESPVVGRPQEQHTATPVGSDVQYTDKRTRLRRVEFKEAENEDDMNLVLDSWSLENALQALLETLPVDNDVWKKADDRTISQITFLTAASDVDNILRALTTFGLGSIPDTSISTFPASFHQAPKPKVQDGNVDVDGAVTKGNLDENRSDFIKTIKSRLTVAQVVAAVEGNARATFDFIMLICLASLIAALGLVENSSVILVASMLISPLMGPILGVVFGFVIKNEKLTWLGLQNSFIGLVLCLVVGFLFGFVVSGVNYNGALWGSSDMWPTAEMTSRGMVRSLWVGVLIALPSGAGVALSVLGGNVGSLVGVAISASLLPPAVNAGMLWAYSIIAEFVPPEEISVENSSNLPSTTISISNDTLRNVTGIAEPWSNPVMASKLMTCPPLKDNAYQFVYSCTMAHEAALLGVVSLVLTLLNILCIFIMGIIVLKIKEVAPHTTVSPVTELFWKKDLPVARDCYKTLKGKDSLDTAKIAKDIAREWRDKHKGLNKMDLRRSWNVMVQDFYKSETLQDIAQLQPTTTVPRGNMLLHSLSYEECHIDQEKSDNTPSAPSTYHTAAGSPVSGEYLRHGNPFFHRYFVPSTSPGYATPLTSDIHLNLTVRARKRRIPRQFQKQASLDKETEKRLMKNLPEKMGRFVVKKIEEEDETAGKSPPDKTAEASASVPFLLKLPEKKTPPFSSADNVTFDIEMKDCSESARERRKEFFANP